MVQDQLSTIDFYPQIQIQIVSKEWQCKASSDVLSICNNYVAIGAAVHYKL